MAAGRHRMPKSPSVKQQIVINQQRKAEAGTKAAIAAAAKLAAGVSRAWNGGA